jgi:hypothetical protein
LDAKNPSEAVLFDVEPDKDLAIMVLIVLVTRRAGVRLEDRHRDAPDL